MDSSPSGEIKAMRDRLLTGGHYANHLMRWITYYSPQQVCSCCSQIFTRFSFENTKGYGSILSFKLLNIFPNFCKVSQFVHCT